MGWKTEMVQILRYLINDIDGSTYSSSRLEKTILVAAQLTLHDVSFAQTYTVDVDESVLTPDPTTGTKDDAFINLVVLKAGCIIDTGLIRSKLSTLGYVVKVGNDMVDTRTQYDAYKTIYEKGFCKIYDEAKWEYELGSQEPGRAILGPFAGPNVNTEYHPFTDYRSPNNF